MRLLTLGSTPIYLLNDLPDWGTPFKASASLLTETEVGLTNREARRAHGQTLRLRLSYQIKSNARDAYALIAALRSHQNEIVAAPLWPAAIRWADRASADITGGLKYVYGKTSGLSAVYDVTEPGWPDPDDIIVPLVAGYLENRKVTWVTDSFATFDVQLAENSPPAWAITPAAYSAPAGPQPAGYAAAPKLFPFLTNWDGPRMTCTLRVNREQIGFGRETSDIARAMAVARTVTQSVWTHAEESWSASKLLRFFLDHGAGATFWASGHHAVAQLVNDLPANATSLAVDDIAAITTGDRIGLIQRGQLIGWLGPVTSTSPGTINLTASGNPASTAETTTLTPLLLACFDSPSIDIEWATEAFASASFQVRELPPELAPPSGETLGVTLGNQPTRCWLYEFTRQFPAASVIERFTSFETDLTFSGNTYLARKLTHGDIQSSTTLDRDEIQIEADGLNVPPMLDAALLRLEVPLVLTIKRAVLSAPGVASVEATAWSGEVTTAKLQAKKINATGVTIGTAFDRKAPRFYLQPGCNHAFLSVGCGRTPSQVEHTGVIDSISGSGNARTIVVSGFNFYGGSGITDASAFAGGWIEWGTGISLIRRPIANNLAASAGVISLSVMGALATTPANGTAVRVYPGCDGRRETCLTRFSNYDNFGGHPNAPKGNPSLVKLSNAAGGGGKK